MLGLIILTPDGLATLAKVTLFGVLSCYNLLNCANQYYWRVSAAAGKIGQRRSRRHTICDFKLLDYINTYVHLFLKKEKEKKWRDDLFKSIENF